jgi:hypothetical protein
LPMPWCLVTCLSNETDDERRLRQNG